MITRAFGLLLAAITLVGCSSAGGAVQCSITSSGSPLGCIDYVGLTTDQEALYERSCTASADAGSSSGTRAAWLRSSCSRVGAFGGCRQQSGGFSVTIWYYGSLIDGGSTPVETYRSSCTMIGGVWVDP